MTADLRETAKKWTIKEFAGRLKEMLAESLPGCCPEVGEVPKNNGVLQTGITLREPGSATAPVLYLDGLYARYRAGEPMERLRDTFLEACQNGRLPGGYGGEQLLDFRNVRNLICLRLVNAAANRESLGEIPHRLFHDLAVAYYVRLWGGSGRMTIPGRLLEQWGMEEGELYALALRNTRELLGLSVEPFSDAVSRITGMPTEKDGMPADPAIPLYLAGAASGQYGACAILYEDILEDFSRSIGGDFYILPSSIHETLFLPAAPLPGDAKSLRQMVRTVNGTEVAPEDVLSDNVYLYHRKEKRLEMLAG